MTSWLVIPHQAIKKRFWRVVVNSPLLELARVARAFRSHCQHYRKHGSKRRCTTGERLGVADRFAIASGPAPESASRARSCRFSLPPCKDAFKLRAASKERKFNYA
jgi:hypothetical protein